MDFEDILLRSQQLVMLLDVMVMLEELERATSRRRWWVRPINEQRPQQGASENLVIEMRLTDEESFFHFTRMNIIQFDELLRLVGPFLIKQNTRRDVISPTARLLVTLRYLATGDSFKSLHFIFRIGHSTIQGIVYETCEILKNKLQPLYLPPLSTEILKRSVRTFETYCAYPNVCGAIDGKHVRIKAPTNSGTMYYNYKKFFSIVLLAVCDARLGFVYVNIGGYGSESDGGIFRNCNLAQILDQNSVQMPPVRTVGQFHLPCVIVGDAAFPLRSYLMTPYSGRNLDAQQTNHNNQLSRARTKIENAFGVLSARWQVFLCPMTIMPTNSDKIIITCVLLHNYLISSGHGSYITEQLVDRHSSDGNRVDGQYRSIINGRSVLESLPARFRMGARNAATEAIGIRNTIKEFLLNNNAVV